jgi:hypothetical protein
MPASAMNDQETALKVRAVADILHVDLVAIGAAVGGDTNAYNSMLVGQTAAAANTFALALGASGALDNQATADKARALAEAFGIKTNQVASALTALVSTLQ